MSYYAPHQGDYKTYGYSGDPGFLSGLWKVVKTVGKSILGIPAKGTIPAAAAGAAAGYGIAQPGIIPSFPGVGQSTPSTLAPAGSRRVQVMAQNGCCPPGFHPSKDGSGKCVKNRSMNVTNPKALRRAMRREAGFGKLAKRMGYVTKKPAARRAPKCA